MLLCGAIGGATFPIYFPIVLVLGFLPWISCDNLHAPSPPTIDAEQSGCLSSHHDITMPSAAQIATRLPRSMQRMGLELRSAACDAFRTKAIIADALAVVGNVRHSSAPESLNAVNETTAVDIDAVEAVWLNASGACRGRPACDLEVWAVPYAAIPYDEEFDGQGHLLTLNEVLWRAIVANNMCTGLGEVATNKVTADLLAPKREMRRACTRCVEMTARLTDVDGANVILYQPIHEGNSVESIYGALLRPSDHHERLHNSSVTEERGQLYTEFDDAHSRCVKLLRATTAFLQEHVSSAAFSANGIVDASWEGHTNPSPRRSDCIQNDDVTCKVASSHFEAASAPEEHLAVPPPGCLRKRGYDVEQMLAVALLHTRYGETVAAAAALSDACSGGSGESPCQIVEALVKGNAAATLEFDSAGPVFLTAGNKDQGRQSDTEGSDKRDPRRLVQPTVGLFLLHSRKRKYVAKHGALARCLCLLAKEHPRSAERLRLHVLTHGALRDTAMDGATMQVLTKENRAWRHALGCELDDIDARGSDNDASWLLGGVHEIMPRMIPNHASHGNYMRKIYAAVSISLTQSYSHLISLDDDVLLPPATLAFMIDETAEPQGAMASAAVSSSSQEGDSSGDSTEGSCAVLTPTLSTGIPTVELWCQHFLQPWEKAFVEKCFAGSSLADWGGYHGHLSSFKDVPDALLTSLQPWSAQAHYRRLQDAADILIKEQPIPSLGLGIHPVRWNRTCTEAVNEFVLRHIYSQFLPPLPSSTTAAPGPHRPEKRESPQSPRTLFVQRPPVGTYPYLCNSVWMARVDDVVFDVLLHGDRFLGWSHPFDEAPMNLVFFHGHHKSDLDSRRYQEAGDETSDGSSKLVRTEQRQMCIVAGAFGIHPSYHHEPIDEGFAWDIHEIAAGLMEKRLRYLSHQNRE